jgi:alkylation response protein AidB-like acyl-CoA dehydrogenase
MHPAIAAASRIADGILFPSALTTDTADLVPLANLEALAEAGLYGIAGAPDYEGAPVDRDVMGYVIEALAGGCLTTAFVWIQHHRPVRALVETTNAHLRDTLLGDMCAGRKRAGVALGGLRQPPQLRATRTDGGWLVTGVMPWMTGWGRIDLLYLTALSDDAVTVCAVVEATESRGLTTRPLQLVAANASGTVEATFTEYFVPDERVTSLDPFVPPPPYDGGGRFNGSLSLGVASRCVRMIGPGGLDAELAARRLDLDAASEREMAQARAAATKFAMRAAVALGVVSGSRSLMRERHEQRLLREAYFLLTFGTRPAIRSSLMERLGVVIP